MKKKASKLMSFMSIMIAGIMSFSLVGCGRSQNPGGIIDESTSSKSILYVGAHHGGFGSNWLETWADKFEQLNKDTVFEPGKKGVDIVVSLNPKYNNDNISMTLNDEIDEICFIEQANYFNFINNDMVLDISEWMITPLEEYGENKSIADKMSKIDKEYYGGKDETNPSYYGAPWYFCMPSLNYDVQLFEDKNYYFAENGVDFVTSSKDIRSSGPDGEKGTMDDGLPITYEDFFKLCDKMVGDEVTPIIWAGGSQSNVNCFLYSLAADFEGKTSMELNYTFNGDANTLVKNIENDIITYEDTTNITIDNGYLLKKQAGFYHGLNFLHKLITTKKNSGLPKYYDRNDCMSQSVSHKSAMQKFLRSNHTNGMKPIAMLCDGNWFYNESTDVFKSMSSIPGCNQKDRRIGIMPMPKVVKDKVGKATYMQSWVSSVFVRSGIEERKLKLARDFFRFCHTDEALSSYVRDAHNVRPFTFDIKGVNESDLSLYGKMQYDIYKNADVVQCYALNSICKQFLADFNIRNSAESIVTKNGVRNSYSLITKAFEDGISAQEYFNGLSTYMTKEKWGPYTRGSGV